MNQSREKIIVLGGSGYIGREICRVGRQLGHHIVSVSKEGRPDDDDPWVEGIEWIQADVFDEEAWTGALDGALSVIDCIGVAVEEDTTFAETNQRSALVAAQAAHRAGVGSFVFLSAEMTPPTVDGSYLDAKRAAETALADTDLDVTILRLPIVFAPDAPGGMLQGSLRQLDLAPEQLGEWTGEQAGLHRSKVAICALRAALEEDISGVLGTDDIEHLGTAAYIQ